jgi:hypothetical protein
MEGKSNTLRRLQKDIDEENNLNYKKCLNDLKNVNNLNDSQLKAVQKICVQKIGELRGAAWEKYKSQMPDIGGKIYYKGIFSSVGFTKSVTDTLNDTKFKKELPADFFKIESLSKKIKEKREDKFTPLFKISEHANQVKRTLESNNYTIKGQWKGDSGQKNELLAAYHALKPIMNPGLRTTQAKIFYSTFGLKVGKDTTSNGEYITDRQLTIIPLSSDIEKFEKLFKEIVFETEKSENSLN